MALTSKPAEAQLDFLFAENVTGSGGNGTITGEIEGLTLNATSTPTAIIILTQPGDYTVQPPPSIDLLTSGFMFAPGFDTFTVGTVNGTVTITAANVGVYATVSSGYQGYAFNVNDPGLGLMNANGVFEADSAGNITGGSSNSGGFGGISYSAVPEPRQATALFLMFAIGLFAIRKLRARLSYSLSPFKPTKHRASWRNTRPCP